MKKLLLILLIAFGMGAMAQDTILEMAEIEKRVWNNKIIVGGEWINGDTIIPSPVNLYDIPITIGDIFEYETECFADSMLVGYKYILEEGDNWMICTKVYTLCSHPKHDPEHYLLNHSRIGEDGTYITSHYLKPPDNYIREEEIREPCRNPYDLKNLFDWLHKKHDIK